jgi:alkanesulfonate monooxygenase SsuD/methylene tetrahydromethanopterin reductase-like flavin-dependent oxidoreductase (luciferase family)
VAAACERIGRDPATMTWSAAVVVCCGQDEAAVVRRAEAIGRDPDELRTNGAAGTPDEVVATLEAWRETGVSRVYLQVLDIRDLDHVALLGEAVLPQLS